MLRALINFSLRHWLIIALATSEAMLGIAHAFQTFGHLEPCTLCLQQRDAYWATLWISAIAVVAGRFRQAAPLKPWFGWALALVFLIGAGIAVRHAGAEWKWWPGPQACSGGGTVSATDLARLMHGAKSAPPRCDEARWRFLWLSMAGWNALISLKLAVWSGIWATWIRRDG